ncbi:MAG: trigger factor [Solirubrobacteraceae bacterium]
MAQLKTSVTELPDSRVRVDAEVPADELERRLQAAARKLGGQLRIPGFRKGKVPPAVVIGRLGREAVLDEALRSALGEWYIDAIDGAGVTPVGEPDFEFTDGVPEAGAPLQFSLEIGIVPVATLGEYRGLEVGRREPTVAEVEIEEELDRLRERLATLDTVERPAQRGDHVVIDYAGSVDGEPFAGGEGRDQLIELGSGRLIPGFEEQLVGAGAGDQRAVTVTFPDDYGASELAGAEASFDVTVSEVKAKRLPEPDDEFAAEASEFDTLAELRDDISKRLRHADEHAVEREFEEAVLQAAADAATVDLPGKLVHARAHELLERTFTALARQGINRETYLKIVGKDEEELARDAEPEAAQALRREAVLAAVVAAEEISPSDDELVAALRPASERDGTDPEELVARLRETGDSDQADRVGRRGDIGRRAARTLQSLREDVAARQALELLVAQAKAITVEQARARDKLWTPGRDAQDASASASGQLWTPGD